MNTKLRTIKVISRTALGLVWFYEGLVPKILLQMLVGLWLITGFAERAAVFIATSWMLILIALVASGNPSMMIDPYGALVKDLCLIACAITVWTLGPRPSPSE